MTKPQSKRQTPWAATDASALDRPALPRIGVISNMRSHRHGGILRRSIDPPEAVTIHHAPENREALALAMQDFVREAVDLIVIDGGDGTVREVMGAAHRAYRGRPPRLAVLPAGKTNALARDLGIPDHWSLEDILAAHRADRIAWRSPIHIRWAHGRHRDQLGFIFGFGAYVRATMLAQRVHRRGGFNGLAVLVTLGWALLRTVLGGAHSPWTRGDTIRLSRDDIDIVSENIYLIFGSTLRHMPLGLRPFGRPRDGLKFLAMKAPPRHLLRSLPRLLWSDRSSQLEQDGFVRRDVERITLSIRKSFILDGERFPGGNLTIAHGTPIAFIVP